MAPRLQTRDRARDLRRAMTRSEVWLWQRLRGGTPRFRRQQPMGPYILDFYCAAAGLAVEIDGGAHRDLEQQDHDAVRDRWLAEHGVRVVRLAAAAVLADPDSAADDVRRLASTLVPPPRTG